MADIFHKDLSGLDLHNPGYLSSSDPGSVGAGKYWIDTSGGTGAWALKVRNAANTGWETTSTSPTSIDHSQLQNLSYASSGHTGFEPTVTKGNLTENTSSVLTITGGSSSVIGSGVSIQVKQSSSTVSGYLSSTDWATFNGKQNALTIGNITSGTGISITGGTGSIIGSGVVVTNTSPDQVVSLTGSGIVSVTGTYPSFTISATETDPKVGTLTQYYVPLWNTTTLVNSTIYDNGNVGIGTSTVPEKLTVNGNARVDSLKLLTTYTPTGSEVQGQLYWDANNHTASLKLSNDVTLQIGQECQAYVKNASGADISNGDAVSVTNVGGSFTTVAATDATNTASALSFMGLATQDIGNNEFGYITFSGIVRDVNTNSWTEGATLFVNPALPGKLTTSTPAAAYYVIKVGVVEYKHSSQGRINVISMVRPKVEDLSGVNGTALTTNGQILVWSQTSGYFDFNYNITNYLTTASASSTYVPYTGATTDVTLGTRSLTLGNFISSGSQTLPLTAKTGAYNVSDSDYTILCDASGAGFSVTLPTAVGKTGRLYVMKKIDSTANAVTVATTGGQTIDGSTYQLTLPYEVITVQSNGSNWFIL